METARNSEHALALWDVNTASSDGSGLGSMTFFFFATTYNLELTVLNVFHLQTEIKKILGCPRLKEL